VQAQPVNPTRGFDSEPGKPMARAQWIAIGLVAAAAVALTAALVFAILTFTRPGDQRAVAPSATAATASPTVQSIASIFATPTPASAVPPTPTLGPPGTTSSQIQVGNTNGDGANLRRDPSQASDRIATIPEGTILTVVGPDQQAEGQTWRNVRDSQGESGWIVASLLVPPGTVPQPAASAPGSGSSEGSTTATAPAAPRPTSATTSGPASRGQVGNTGGQGANIRSEPGASGRVLKTLAEGTPVEVLGPAREVDGRTWRQVRDASGVTGWLVGGAVVPPGTVPTPAPPVIVPAATTAAGPTSAPKPAGPTSAPAATPKPSGGPTPPPAAGPTSTPSGNLPVIIQPATPLPKPGSSPAPGH
jgi:SH3-like domain-containing protein